MVLLSVVRVWYTSIVPVSGAPIRPPSHLHRMPQEEAYLERLRSETAAAASAEAAQVSTIAHLVHRIWVNPLRTFSPFVLFCSLGSVLCQQPESGPDAAVCTALLHIHLPESPPTACVQLGNVRGQIGELQNMLNGMGQQRVAEQAMRRSDSAAFDGAHSHSGT